MISDVWSSRIAVVSDTHGHLAPALLEGLKDVELILHAGDLDSPKVLEALQVLAPVMAVRGNMDRGAWTRGIPDMDLTPVNGTLVYMIHDLTHMDIDPESIGVGLVISGHTHRPLVERRGTVIYLNPGSPTLPRGGFPPSLALIHFKGNGALEVEIVHL